MAAPPGRLSVGESRDSATASAVDPVNQRKIHRERLGGSRGSGAGDTLDKLCDHRCTVCPLGRERRWLVLAVNQESLWKQTSEYVYEGVLDRVEVGRPILTVSGTIS